MTPQVRDNVVQFDEEQAVMLEQLAAQLAQDEDFDVSLNTYGYADVNPQANGFFPHDENFNSAETYQFAGLPTDFQYLQDPTFSANLPEDFTNTGCTPQDAIPNSTNNSSFAELLEDYPTASKEDASTTDDAFAGLFEAVAAAGKESAIRERLFSLPDDGYFIRSFVPEDRSKRQREADNAIPSIERLETVGSKRRKTTPPRKCSEESATERELWGPEDDEDETQDEAPSVEFGVSRKSKANGTARSTNPTLYRTPTKAPRKYSRPAMSKLFSSLELQPEPFLYLQAAAKIYMLDPDHPDRKECVGVKGRGESDTTKLKLYATVKAFLKNEGWGTNCFGSAAPDIDTRKLRWPEHEHKLIALVTPLMRRMVTNERQRQYALEKRQSIMGTKDRVSPATPSDSLLAPTPRPSEADSPILYDISLDQCSLKQISSASTNDTYSAVVQHNGNVPLQQNSFYEPVVQYHVNIMENGRRMQPKVVLTPTACPSFSNLTEHIGSLIEDLGQNLKCIQVLGPGSLLEVKDEITWKEAVEMIQKSEWMDGDVKCVVEVETVV